MLKGHGNNAYQLNNNIIADFSSNIYFKGPTPKLLAYLKKHIKNIVNYPEVAAENLSNQIAKKHQLTSGNILVTNGATEAFYLLAQLFKNDTSDIFTPSFAEYEDACKLYNHNINLITNNKLTSTYKSKANNLWICNPNNPDGKKLPKSDIENIVNKNPNSLIIIDEAYADFLVDNISLIDKVKTLPNLIIVRSMTKKFSIPGLRLGHIIASSKIISKLLQIKQPWSVNSLAIEAGKFIMQQNTDFDVAQLISLSKSLQASLSEIEGIEVIPSDTSFFLIKIKKSANQTVQHMAKEYGFLLRNASNFKTLDDSFIRISTRSAEDNKKLVIALRKWMNT